MEGSHGDTSSDEPWLTLDQVAEKLGCPVARVRHHVESGSLEVRVHETALQQYLVDNVLPASRPNAPLPSKPWLTVNETAKYLGVSRSTVYRLLKSGHLESRTVGARIRRISRSAIDKMLTDPNRP